MDRELEAIIEALDAVRDATGMERKRLWAVYDFLLDDVLARRPGLSREGLEAAIVFAYQRWCHSQNKPTTLPPKA